jgi:hypothetical protein
MKEAIGGRFSFVRLVCHRPPLSASTVSSHEAVKSVPCWRAEDAQNNERIVPQGEKQ